MTPRKSATVAAATEQPGFDEAVGRIEQILQQLERGDLELDRALALFEEGVALLRAAGSALEGAEQRVEQLMGDGDDLHFQPFSSPG